MVLRAIRLIHPMIFLSLEDLKLMDLSLSMAILSVVARLARLDGCKEMVALLLQPTSQMTCLLVEPVLPQQRSISMVLVCFQVRSLLLLFLRNPPTQDLLLITEVLVTSLQLHPVV